MGYGYIHCDVIYKVYKTNIGLNQLSYKIDYHEDRLNR
jgi:hypothetical protein